MRKFVIAAAGVGLATALVLLAKRILSGRDPMSGIDASGQDSFGAPEQRWSPAKSESKLSVEQLQDEAKLEQAREDVMRQWPQISADDFAAAGDDLDKLAETIASRTGQSRENVTTTLRGLVTSATDGKASFPVT
ncbi:MAG: hypothetical protein ACR2PL_02180 [Dehalococcoidia bacterium]